MLGIRVMLVMFNVDADIDECLEGTHSCSQICVNNPGSYSCGCNSGFSLTFDGFGCTGE